MTETGDSCCSFIEILILVLIFLMFFQVSDVQDFVSYLLIPSLKLDLVSGYGIDIHELNVTYPLI